MHQKQQEQINNDIVCVAEKDVVNNQTVIVNVDQISDIQSNQSTLGGRAKALEKIKRMCKERPSAASGNGPANEGPNDDDPDDPEDDENNFFEKLKNNYIDKGLADGFGNLYKDPKSEFWWSYARGTRHGGPHCKVFQKGVRGFDWVFDATLDGVKIFYKHKGDIGMHIPYQRVSFSSRSEKEIRKKIAKKLLKRIKK
jgi:hypothetical protein